MANDLRERYARVIKERDVARTEQMQAKANLTALEAREQELKEEAKLLGANSLEELSTLIASEEALIVSELDMLEKALQGAKLPAPQVHMIPSDKPLSVTDIDDLLIAGSQS